MSNLQTQIASFEALVIKANTTTTEEKGDVLNGTSINA